MAGVSLFRKWRSQKFSDLLYQDNVVRTLKNVLESGAPARAYLFCGPRGTGKTSAARIFAKSLCCEKGPTLEPCGDCSLCRSIAIGSCMDVFEIDAASNTQVEKIRDFIVDKVYFAPSQARYKVYIIDEVHKLSSASFNALLKTLEEPPPHVVFVLATTHPQELLPTILSRCQRYDFRPFTLTQLREHLSRVAHEEGLELQDEACLLLAKAAGGSMRDALVLLEQSTSYCGKRIEAGSVNEMLGWLPFETMRSLLEALANGRGGRVVELLSVLSSQGAEFAGLCDQLSEYLRWMMLLKLQSPDSTLEELSEAQRLCLNELAPLLSMANVLNWLKGLLDCRQRIAEGAPSRLALEVALVAMTVQVEPSASPPKDMESLMRRVEALEKGLGPPAKISTTVTSGAESSAGRPSVSKAVSKEPREHFVNPLRRKEPPEGVSKDSAVPPESPKSETKVPPQARVSDPAPLRVDSSSPSMNKPVTETVMRSECSDRDFWLQLRESIRKKDTRLNAILNDALLSHFEPPQITISFPSDRAWHHEQVTKAKGTVEAICQEILGGPVRLVVAMGSEISLPDDESQHSALVKRATGLFAGKIVES